MRPTVLFALALFIAVPVPALAHVGGHGSPVLSLRTWTDPSTGIPVPASLLMVRDGRVHLELPIGGRVAWPLESLTAEDRRVAESHIHRIAALNGRPVTMPAPPDSNPLLWFVVFALGAGLAFTALMYRAGITGFRPLAIRGAAVSVVAALALACSDRMVDGGRTGVSPTSPSGILPGPRARLAAFDAGTLASYFAAFPGVQTRSDADYLYVESNGMADHTMMVGIRSWQQQVPLPQSYRSDNAFRIPLNPQFSDRPVSLRGALFRGAVGVAVNGIPIFNALNNRGEDAYLAGELDEFGGHAGRADDYHYHTAPLHLESAVGPGMPVAVALDGFPLYGAGEPDVATGGALDAFSGHGDTEATYHYHGGRVYPYINGGMRGVVTVVDDQIEPQPTTPAIRPAGAPLAGATVTGFRANGVSAWSLEYQLNGGAYRVDYRVEGSTYTFVFMDPSGATRTETYTAPSGGGPPPPSPSPSPTPTPSPSPPASLPSWYSAFYGAVTVSLQGADAVLRTTTLPDHVSPYWGPGHTLYEAPHSGMRPSPQKIVSQNITLRVPIAPAIAAAPSDTPIGPMGIAINGVVLFNQYTGARQPLTNEFVSFDRMNGHPSQLDQYHYHLEPLWLTRASSSRLIGVMLDGFPVYGPRDANGSPPSNLDSCNGHTHATAEFTGGTYHYHVTANVPYISGCFKGTPGRVAY